MWTFAQSAKPVNPPGTKAWAAAMRFSCSACRLRVMEWTVASRPPRNSDDSRARGAVRAHSRAPSASSPGRVPEVFRRELAHRLAPIGRDRRRIGKSARPDTQQKAGKQHTLHDSASVGTLRHHPPSPASHNGTSRSNPRSVPRVERGRPWTWVACASLRVRDTSAV
jgi:hypothetical protein